MSSRKDFIMDKLANNDLNDYDRAMFQVELDQILQQEREQQESSDQIAFLLDTLEYDGMTMREMCIGEDHYQMLRLRVQQALISISDKANERIAALQRENDASSREKSELLRQVQQIGVERDESIQTKNNAATQLAEAQEEIKRLTSHNEDLQTQIAIGVRNSIKVVAPEEQQRQMDELAQRIRDSKIRVTNIRFKDEIKKNTYLAELCSNGETVEFPWTEKGKYIDTPAEEVWQFREAPDADHSLDNVPSYLDAPPMATAVGQFQTPSELGAEPGTVGQVAEPDDRGVVSREEFEALKADVEALKGIAGRWAA